MELADIQIYVPPFRSVLRSMVLHQADEAGGGAPQIRGDMNDCVSGRYPDNESVSPTLANPTTTDGKPLGVPGFVINESKSDLKPSQKMQFLGFLVDSVKATLSLPSRKLAKIRHELRRTLGKPTISLRQLARVVGLFSSSIQAIFLGPLHYRALQRLKASHLRKGLTYSQFIPLSEEAKTELRWWISHLEAWNGWAIFESQPDQVIESDASGSGWGAHCGDISSCGKWSSAEQGLQINCLELMAGSFAVKCWTKDKAQCCVLLKMDNVAAIHYINHLEGTRFGALLDLAQDLWMYCLFNQISLLAEHLPGTANQVADWCSRHWKDTSLWKLHPGVFRKLQSLWGFFSIDLFASRLDTKLQRYYSWRPDSEVLVMDAFLHDWSTEQGCAFPSSR